MAENRPQGMEQRFRPTRLSECEFLSLPAVAGSADSRDYAGSTDANPERWRVTQAMIEAEIKKARKAKAEHSGEGR